MQPLKPLVRTARRRSRELRDRQPLLSVVVPFHESSTTLEACVDSLLAQTHSRLQVLLVDDGADPASRELARQLVRRDRRLHLLTQPHAGVGAARNLGAAKARGDFLAFCDADDRVPPQGYARLVGSLVESGSDLAVGALTLQDKGRHVQPSWLARSNARRQQQQTLLTSPDTVANHYAGARVFRTAFWRGRQLAFTTEADGGTDYSDVVTMVRALVAASSFDVVPAVTYHWHWRTDDRSLAQLALKDPRRVVDKVEAVRQAAELLVDSTGEDVQSAFFAGVLHNALADLVRGAMARDAEYWSALSGALARLTDLIPHETWQRVPVEDRVLTWLCAHDHREATEEYLLYAFDNPTGLPHEVVDGVPRVTLPVVDALADPRWDLTTVAEADLVCRTRLHALRWVSPHVLELTGLAFVEYLSAHVDTTTRLLLVNRTTGHVTALDTTEAPEVNANMWANRAHEDHDRHAFRVEVDAAQLPVPVGGREVLDVVVEHTAGGRTWRAGFQTRAVEGSAGLLEPAEVDGHTVNPIWRKYVGLTLAMRRGRPGPVPGPSARRTSRTCAASRVSWSSRATSRTTGRTASCGSPCTVLAAAPTGSPSSRPAAASRPGSAWSRTTGAWAARPCPPTATASWSRRPGTPTARSRTPRATRSCGVACRGAGRRASTT